MPVSRSVRHRKRRLIVTSSSSSALSTANEESLEHLFRETPMPGTGRVSVEGATLLLNSSTPTRHHSFFPFRCWHLALVSGALACSRVAEHVCDKQLKTRIGEGKGACRARGKWTRQASTHTVLLVQCSFLQLFQPPTGVGVKRALIVLEVTKKGFRPLLLSKSRSRIKI